MTYKDIRGIVRQNLGRLVADRKELSPNHHFTDPELDVYINNASKRFLEQTGILTSSETITVTDGSGTMPDNVIKVQRLEIANEPINWLYKQQYDEDWPAV